MSMAAYRSELEPGMLDELPPLDDLESGKPIGAILPMSEEAQGALRDRLELIEYLVNGDHVTWN
jgi:hypothetical protein